ncbi:hypothetical protein B0A49_06417 [Cryomyces minteri]|uniref:RNA-binding S4 domain-containing protein n=2 Tax=Cryomyces minteri TaxID=331657 RepID=A0A4U0WZV0_9PEZI|nr:hypothetical protein B0A49_06417 [Cryomyces minteri]
MRQKFHNLKKVKVRQTWNKYNLYNLSRMTTPNASSRTFFQQKWGAKSLTRAYHGEQIREGQWTRMFRSHMPSVVPMDHQYLAQHDGSEQAAGRGSGLDLPPGEKKRALPKTPYMHMVYHPTERRLDTAIWRALFASSTRQARQFVVHGFVKVNGKKMIYPGYLLNPGDMFSVEPERVLWGTGHMKGHKLPEDSERRQSGQNQRADESDDVEKKGDDKSATQLQEASPSESEPVKDPKAALKALRKQAEAILENPKQGRTLSAKGKQELRAFKRQVKTTISRPNASTERAIAQNLESTFEQLKATLLSEKPASTTTTAASDTSTEPETLSPKDEYQLRVALQRAYENPRDPSKPYATPWRPREYMSAFAFIPRYLEVNQNICSAVYLRHPVARPGLAEVPTPFHTETSQLAFTWYLRRR